MRRTTCEIIAVLIVLLMVIFSANVVNGQTPITLNAKADSDTSVSLSWAISNADGAIPNYEIIAGFELFMSSTGLNGPYDKVWSTLNNQLNTTTVSGLSSNGSYCFYVVAIGLSGNYKSNIVQVMMPLSSSSTPTVPELSWLAIVPLLFSVVCVAVIVCRRKQVKKV